MRVHRRVWRTDGGWDAPLPAVDGARTWVTAFAGPRCGGAPIADVLAAYPTSAVIGASTAGEIAGGQLLDDAVVVSVVTFDRADVRAAVVPIAEGSRAAGEALGRALAAPSLRAVFTLSDGLAVNGTELAAGLAAAVGPAASISGGLAGDGARFGSTWLLAGGEVGGGRVAAVGLYGDAIQVGAGSRGGWDRFGPERRVTSATGNVVRTLDGRPALALYKEYLGDSARGLPAAALRFPLALRLEGRDLVRTILHVNEADQSLTFAGDVPEGATVQLMRAHVERLIDGAAGAGAMAGAALREGPTLALAVSCVGRRLVLGERVDEELEACLEGLPPGTVLSGFYSYGELSPVDGRCELHNQTMTVTAIQELAS